MQITFTDNEVQFGKLHVDAAPCAPGGDEIFYFRFDPLTSRGVPSGLCTALMSEVKSLTPVLGLPVTEDFVVDSISVFYDGVLVQNTETDLAKPDAVSFLRRIFDFASDMEISNARGHGPELRSRDFTALGLDFMRQHYRAIKSHFLSSRSLPPREILVYLLESTQCSRTTDADWAHCRIPG